MSVWYHGLTDRLALLNSNEMKLRIFAGAGIELVFDVVETTLEKSEWVYIGDFD